MKDKEKIPDKKKDNELNFLNQKLSRREFIKKGIVAIGGLALAGYTIDRLLMGKSKDAFSSIFKNDAPSTLWKWSREADHYITLQNAVQCKLCPHECILNKNDRGRCRTRVNIDNKLYTLTYGNPCSVNVDPIEKKPLYHFLPGTGAFSLSTAGCNLHCLYCQNWQISQFGPEDTRNYDLMPDDTVKAVLQAKAQNPLVKSIAYTYGEPTSFYEYMKDTSKLAGKQGIKNVVITAGYMQEKPMKELCKYVDAIKVDLKGFNDAFMKKVTGSTLEPELKAIKTIHQSKVWLEIVYLMIPTMNDNMEEIRQMSEWLIENCDKDVPVHFSRFHPLYKLTNLPATPLETLKKARKVSMDAGLNYVYVGNVPHGDYENTYCPKCKKLVIERIGYIIKQNNIKDGKCVFCGKEIKGVWA